MNPAATKQISAIGRRAGKIKGAAPSGSATPGEYRYRLRSSGYSSERYGSCEVCKRPCTEVFLQVEQRFYRHFTPAGVMCSEGWTDHECHGLFGHAKCLKRKRRSPKHAA